MLAWRICSILSRTPIPGKRSLCSVDNDAETLNPKADCLGINIKRCYLVPEMIHAVVESLLFCGPDIHFIYFSVTKRE